MSEPNTSEPLHSSCTRQVILVRWSGSLVDVAEQIDRDAADRRQEHLQVGPRHQLGKHAGGLLEQCAAQIVLGGAEALGDARQVPDRIDRDLDHRDAAVLVHDLAVVLAAVRRRSPPASPAGRGARG